MKCKCGCGKEISEIRTRKAKYHSSRCSHRHYMGRCPTKKRIKKRERVKPGQIDVKKMMEYEIKE